MKMKELITAVLSRAPQRLHWKVIYTRALHEYPTTSRNIKASTIRRMCDHLTDQRILRRAAPGQYELNKLQYKKSERQTRLVETIPHVLRFIDMSKCRSWSDMLKELETRKYLIESMCREKSIFVKCSEEAVWYK